MKYDAYLYMNYRGSIRVYNGVSDDRVLSKYSIFYPTNGKKHYVCCAHRAVVYNRMVWLTIRDDELARDLLMAAEELMREAGRKKVQQHTLTLKKLQKTVPQLIVAAEEPTKRLPLEGMIYG